MKNAEKKQAAKPGTRWPVTARIFYWWLAALLAVQAATGQNYTRPNIMGPDNLQVNSFTGNLFTQRNDLILPGRGLSVSLNFTYNSTGKDNDFGFGYGWNLGYNQFYKDTANGLLFQREDGRKEFYGPVPLADLLVFNRGVFDKLSSPGAGQYLLTSKDGMQYYFENASNKKLTRIKDRNGNEIKLSYAGANLSSITDASGRVINLVWSAGHLQSINTSGLSPARSISYAYNVAGCLTSTRNAAGYTTQYAYAPGRMLNDLIDGNGNENKVQYNSNFAVVKLSSCMAEKSILYKSSKNKTYVTDKTDSKTETTIYAFDGEGKLASRTGNCCGFSTSFSYDGLNDITRIVDAAGNATVYGYDNRGNLLSETDPYGRSIRYTYESSFNQVTSITDKNGNKTSYTYDTRGNLIETDYPLGIAVKYGYDDKGNLTSRRDGRGNQTLISYNDNGYPLSVTDPLSNTSIYTYDDWGNALTKTDANGHLTKRSYDLLSRATVITDALNNTTKYNYDAHNNVLGVIDANNNQTSYGYDPYDKMIFRKDALNNMISSVFDGLGNPVQATDANGHASNYSADNLNEITSVTNAAGETTTFNYDAKGNPVSIHYPNGNTVNTEYDMVNRAVRISDNLGVLYTCTYDANGNKLSQTDGAGKTVVFRYDALNRLVAKFDPAGNSYLYEYDANNNLTKQTDRNGNSTVYAYDAVNRLLSTTDAISAVTAYSYDKAGNQTYVTDANGNKTSYAYDAVNRKIIETFADNTTKKYGYDNVSNLIARTDNNGQLTKYNYDKAYRLISRVYPTSTDAFTYDNAGNILSANNGQAQESFGYDAINRLLNESLNGKRTQYAYNTSAGIQTIVYPGGKTIQRGMDARNQLVSITETGKLVPLAFFVYDGSGQNLSRTFANGVTNSFNYTAKGNVAGSADAPLHILDVSYKYDKEDNPVNASFSNTSSLSGQYSYDKVNQLTAFSSGSQQQTFNYDKVNNRTTANINGVAASYSVNNMNAYSKIMYGSNIITPQYDLNGNLKDDGSRRYNYDIENRIISVDGGATASYLYDAIGRRIQKLTPTDTINYYYSGLQVIEEHNFSDAITKSYTWGSWVDDIVSMQTDSSAYYYNKNLVGSILSISDSSGALTERYEYDGFGKFSIFDKNNNAITNSGIGNVYAFTGREYDGETQLYYYRARYYDAANGRFLQRDPFNYRDGLASYAYTHNNPLSKLDPFGTFTIANINWCDVAAFAIITTLVILAAPEEFFIALGYLGSLALEGASVAIEAASPTIEMLAQGAELWAYTTQESLASFAATASSYAARAAGTIMSRDFVLQALSAIYLTANGAITRLEELPRIVLGAPEIGEVELVAAEPLSIEVEEGKKALELTLKRLDDAKEGVFDAQKLINDLLELTKKKR